MNLCRLSLVLCFAACGPGSGDSTAAELTTGEPGTDGAGTAAVTGTVPTEPATSEPTTSEPATSEPGTTEPGTTEPSTTGSTDTGTTSATTSAGETTGAEPACACAAEDCGPLICDPVVQACEVDCMNVPAELADKAALDCALVALRDRTPGGLRWQRVVSDGLVDDVVELWILGDGTAYVHRAGNDDMDAYVGPDGFYTVRDAEYFADCLLEQNIIARFNCLRGAVQEPLQECVPFTPMGGDP